MTETLEAAGYTCAKGQNLVFDEDETLHMRLSMSIHTKTELEIAILAFERGEIQGREDGRKLGAYNVRKEIRAALGL